MPHLKNKHNEYAELLPNFDKIPKSVLAAIAVSFALRHNNEDLNGVEQDIIREWAILHNNEIVPQKPIKI